MRKLRITLTAIIASLIVLLALALFVEFDAPWLGQRILDGAGESAGIELQAGAFRFNLRRGIILESVVATAPFPGGTVVTTVERVVLEARLLPLLAGDIVIDRLVLENPVIEIIADGDDVSSRTAVREPTIRAYGLDVELTDIVVDSGAPSVAIGLSAHGHIDVGEIHVGGRIAEGNRAQLTADNGIFTVTGLELTTPEGRFRAAELVVDLTSDPYFYRASLAGADIDLNGFLGIEESGALGLVSIEMDVAGTGPETANVVGTGRIHLAAGRIPDLPALDQVTELLGLHLAGLRYEAATIEFSVGGDRVELSPFEILSEGLRLEASGELAIDGGVDAKARVSVPRQDLNLGNWQGDLSDGIVEALTDENGWVSIPLLIGGTVDELQVQPDSTALLAALQEAAGNSLGSWLRRVIKRN